MAEMGVERLRALFQRQHVLLDINRAVARELAREPLFRAITRSLARIASFTRLVLLVPVPETHENVLYFVDDEAAMPSGRRFPANAASLVTRVLDSREQVVVNDLDEIAEYTVATGAMKSIGVRSGLFQPLIAGDQAIGAVVLMHREPGKFVEVDRALLDEASHAIARALANTLAYEENARLRAQLSEENVALRTQLTGSPRTLIGDSAAMRAVRELIDTVAPTDAAVLITGETGTGKELVADRIHRNSRRSTEPLIKVNCAAIAAGVVESTLFGHEAGAFTGAVAARPGRFEAADRGTILLDEVGDLALGTQAKLLRVLESGEFERVGSSVTRSVDVRVLAATNRDLHTMISAAGFRADLFHRLSVFPIELTPLRERREDIKSLAELFVAQMAAKLNKAIYGLEPAAISRLCAHNWPGNVRELENVIERAVLLCPGHKVRLACIDHVMEGAGSGSSTRLDDVLRDHIIAVLDDTDWVVEGGAGAAARLGIAASTLRSRMHKLGIERPA